MLYEATPEVEFMNVVCPFSEDRLDNSLEIQEKDGRTGTGLLCIMQLIIRFITALLKMRGKRINSMIRLKGCLKMLSQIIMAYCQKKNGSIKSCSGIE